MNTPQTFWALPIFNQPTPSEGEKQQKLTMPSGFVTSFVLVPILTCLLSLVFAYLASSSRARPRIKTKLGEWYEASSSVPLHDFKFYPKRIFKMTRISLKRAPTAGSGTVLEA